MTVWDELKLVLGRLRESDPQALQGWPNPDASTDPLPPFVIRLEPWAAAIAAELHQRFGESVDLTVGYLGYPAASGRQTPPPGVDQEIDPAGIRVYLERPISVPSGHWTRTSLRLENLTGEDLEVITNGQLTALVADAAGAAIVGGFSGAQALPRVTYEVRAGDSSRIPLLVGTASLVAAIGYAVPPGPWAVRVPIQLGDGRRLVTPPLPITVTAQGTTAR